MATDDMLIHPSAPRPIAIRRQAGVQDLLACVLTLQQRTAAVLGVLGPRGDTAAAESLRHLHARLAVDAHVLAGLLDAAGPPSAPR
jgi:hypothetical protein